MVNITLLIGDIDSNYIKALEAYLMETHSQRFHISLYTQREGIEKKLREGDFQGDLLLLHPRLVSDWIIEHWGDRLVLLTEGTVLPELSQYPQIYKYQRGDKLVGEILKYLPKERSIPLEASQGTTDFYVVYGPQGGVGKTTLSLGLAGILAGKGRQVLYLSLEDLPSTGAYFDCKGNEEGAQLFYYIKEGGRQLLSRLEALKRKDPVTQIHYFLPPDRIGEQQEVTLEEWESFLQLLREGRQYDDVILDLGSGWSQKIQGFYQLCHGFYLVTDASPISLHKTKKFLDSYELMQMVSNYGEERLLLCLNQREKTSHYDWEVLPIQIRLPYDHQLTSKIGEQLKINLDSAFIKELNKHMRQRSLKELKASGNEGS